MAFIQPHSVNAWQPMYCLVSYECKEQPGRQPASLSSRLAMCKRAPSSQPAASDLPDAASIPAPPEMNGHLILDILTLAFVVVAAVLFLSIKVWLRRRAAAAKRAADLEAEKAAALSVKTQGTMTDSLLFDIDETLSKVYKELASHQTRLDSFEQQRLEMMSVHRVLSLLPKPVLPSQGEDNYTWDFQEPANNPETTADEGDGFVYPTV